MVSSCLILVASRSTTVSSNSLFLRLLFIYNYIITLSEFLLIILYFFSWVYHKIPRVDYYITLILSYFLGKWHCQNWINFTILFVFLFIRGLGIYPFQGFFFLILLLLLIIHLFFCLFELKLSQNFLFFHLQIIRF